jgi:hypothetical protein
MRVKLFWKNNPLGPHRFLSASEANALDFENEINDWLRSNPGVRIVDIKQSASGGSYSLHVAVVDLGLVRGIGRSLRKGSRITLAFRGWWLTS